MITLPTISPTDSCPCGDGQPYADCCQPLHEGQPAASAGRLMRSRYSAYTLQLIDYLVAEDPDKLWQSNIFGKSVYALIQEGLTAKLLRTPEDVRAKFRGTLTRVVNEGASGLICLIL